MREYVIKGDSFFSHGNYVHDVIGKLDRLQIERTGGKNQGRVILSDSFVYGDDIRSFGKSPGRVSRLTFCDDRSLRTLARFFALRGYYSRAYFRFFLIGGELYIRKISHRTFSSLYNRK